METCFRTWALHPPQASPGNGSSYGASRRAVVSLPPSTATSSSSVLSVRRVWMRRSRFACQANVVDEVQVADEKNWESMVIGSGTPVLVDFWAPWCGPCRMMDPVITELAKEYAGKIKCCKVNTDDCPNIASTYGIRSIPTVLVFKDGEKEESVIGAVAKASLRTIIDKYLDG